MSYHVRGRTAATAATADHAICNFWNPHSTQRIKVLSFLVFKTAAGIAGDSFRLRRSTTRGTPGSTVTPDIDHHSERAIAPPSGVLLDLAAFTGQPTFDASDIPPGWTAAAQAASGLVYPIPGGIILPPGTGIGLVQVAATAWPISEIGFSWLEDW
jgi:hypothetical protein